MPEVYFIFAALQIVGATIAAVLWVAADLAPGWRMHRRMKEIQATHHGSLFIASIVFSFAFVFDRVAMPGWFWIAFPIGLMVLYTMGVAYNVVPLADKSEEEGAIPGWTRTWIGTLAPIAILYLIGSLVTASVMMFARVPTL